MLHAIIADSQQQQNPTVDCKSLLAMSLFFYQSPTTTHTSSIKPPFCTNVLVSVPPRILHYYSLNRNVGNTTSLFLAFPFPYDELSCTVSVPAVQRMSLRCNNDALHLSDFTLCLVLTIRCLFSNCAAKCVVEFTPNISRLPL